MKELSVVAPILTVRTAAVDRTGIAPLDVIPTRYSSLVSACVVAAVVYVELIAPVILFQLDVP